jgi:hypothetical protein
MYKSKKVLLLVAGFCKHELLRASRAFFEPLLTPGLIDEKVLLLNKYPLPSVKENEEGLIQVAKDYGYKTWDSKADLGLHMSLNYYLENNPQPPGTILMGLDADSCTDSQKGFDKALCEVLDGSNGLLGSVSLWNVGMDNTVRRFPIWDNEECIANHKVFVHPHVEMMNITVFDLDVITNAGGFQEPYKYYGGMEMWLLSVYKPLGKKFGFLMNYKETGNMYPIVNDPEYRQWKNDHLRGDTSSFGEWLVKNGKVIDND